MVFMVLQFATYQKSIDMIVTPGSISMLIAGANVADLDVTAIREDGKQYFAALLQCEDDAKLRKRMAIDEFQPILQVVSRTWHGSFGRFPNIMFLVTDGSQEMSMRVSYRRTEFPILFFGKRGPFHRGCLNVGRKIKLLDYTMELKYEKDGTASPTIHIEKFRSEPRKVVTK